MDVTLVPQYAELTTFTVLTTVALGLLFVARLFLKDDSTGLNEDDTPTTLATRGSFCNVVIGRRQVGPVFAWAGQRFTRQESSGGGGGKGGGASSASTSQTVYFEDGWHVICLGPAGVLHRIMENGKNILPSPISAANTPSGSTIETEMGSFQIYWGEVDQPLNSALVTRLGGIASTWPFLCYVFWRGRRLGSSPTWPSTEYDIEVLCQQSAPGTFEPTLTDADNRRGANPASAMHQLITANWPHGCGLAASKLDFDSLEALGLQMEVEEIPVNFLLRDGDNEATKWMQAILADVGCLLVDYPDGRLGLPMLREPVFPLPVVDESFQTAPEVEVEVIPFTDIGQADRVMFTFKNIDLRYRDDTIEFGDDGVAEENSRYRIERVRIDTVTSPLAARVVGNRRAPEVMGDVASIKYPVIRGASLLMPGQVFEDAEGRIVRVLSTKRGVRVPEATLEAMIDTYGLPPLPDADDPGGVAGNQPAVPDAMVTLIELPASVSGATSIAVAVLRARANRSQFGSDLWFSIDDGANYTLLGQQNASCSGFLLTEGLDASAGPEVLETGPTLVSNNPDAGEVLNLAAQVSEWQNGRQLCLIEAADGSYEATFLREIELLPETIWAPETTYSVGDYVIPSAPKATGLRYRCVATSGTAESGTVEPDWPTLVSSTVADNEVTWKAERFEYRLLGLIRARYETTAKTFVAGAKVFIVETSKITPIRSLAMFLPGETLCVKTTPRTASDVLNIDNAIAYCRQLTGAAIATPGFDFIIDGDGNLIVTNIGDRLIAPE
jgi:hypothetical protein